MLFSLAACGGTVAEEKPPLTEDEITQMYSTPDSFKGRQVTLVGKVLGNPEKDDSGVYFQMYGDPANYELNTIVGYKNTDISLSSDDYVKITGKVDGAFKGENMMGGKITAPKIVADSVEKVSYIDAMSPTLKSVDVNSTQDQFGYNITLNKVEFAKTETRVYVSITNNGSKNFGVYGVSSKIKQGSNQYDYQSNYEAGYPDLQSNIMPGVTTEGIITFPPLEQANFTFIITGISQNWRESVNPFSFEVSIS